MNNHRSEQLRRQFDVNIFGTMDVTTAVLPHMRARRSGTVVIIGSRSSWRPEVPVCITSLECNMTNSNISFIYTGPW
jgi:short-subunit dehydrogenase